MNVHHFRKQRGRTNSCRLLTTAAVKKKQNLKKKKEVGRKGNVLALRLLCLSAQATHHLACGAPGHSFRRGLGQPAARGGRLMACHRRRRSGHEGLRCWLRIIRTGSEHHRGALVRHGDCAHRTVLCSLGSTSGGKGERERERGEIGGERIARGALLLFFLLLLACLSFFACSLFFRASSLCHTKRMLPSDSPARSCFRSSCVV